MKKLFNIFHNYSLITLLILVITGCSNKVYEFRVNETSKQISNDELSKMSFDEFYDGFVDLEAVSNDEKYGYFLINFNFNTKDFLNSEIKAISPSEFLAQNK